MAPKPPSTPPPGTSAGRDGWARGVIALASRPAPPLDVGRVQVRIAWLGRISFEQERQLWEQSVVNNGGIVVFDCQDDAIAALIWVPSDWVKAPIGRQMVAAADGVLARTVVILHDRFVRVTSPDGGWATLELIIFEAHFHDGVMLGGQASLVFVAGAFRCSPGFWGQGSRDAKLRKLLRDWMQQWLPRGTCPRFLVGHWGPLSESSATDFGEALGQHVCRAAGGQYGRDGSQSGMWIVGPHARLRGQLSWGTEHEFPDPVPSRLRGDNASRKRRCENSESDEDLGAGAGAASSSTGSTLEYIPAPRVEYISENDISFPLLFLGRSLRNQQHTRRRERG